MVFIPEVSYNFDQKIWSGVAQRSHFSKDLSVGEIIFHEMERHPNLIAQISHSENTVLTREELLLNSKRVANYLRNMKLNQSDIVGIIARNTTHITSVIYGCFFNGIAIHSLNTNYDRETIGKLFETSKPKIIFCDGDEYEKVKAVAEKLNVKIVTMRNHKEGSIRIEELLTTPVEPFFQPLRLQQGNTQNLAILCSSGTTGTPKAVTIPNSLSNAFPFIKTTDVAYVHSSSDWMTGLFSIISSGTHSVLRIITDKPFDPLAALQIIKKYKVTFHMTSPPYLAQMLNCPESKEDYLQSLKFVFYGGSSCPVDVERNFRRLLSPHCLYIYGYGFTELSGGGTWNLHFDQKPNSVGRLSGEVKMKILNEQGEALGPNEVGEVCLYTGNYWAGYYGNPEETRKMQDSNMWYHSGDLGRVDEDGFLYIVDRKKELLKYLGNHYYPQEIEKIVSKMPGVSEVCVFGKQSAIHGDEAAAAVICKHGVKLEPQDVIDFVAKHVEPKYLHLNGGVYIVDSLKLTTSGKHNRRDTKAYCLSLPEQH